jgi:hypothetical protein
MDKDQVSAAPADREAWMKEATMTDLHAQIMNIPCKPYDGTDAYTHYCRGHRDARHAAAELASEALRAAAPAAVPLQPLTIFKQALLAYADEEYCRALRMFRTEPCLGWEAKAKSGKYRPAEHDAHRKADEHMGAHRGIYAAVRAADAMLAASPPPPAAIAPAPADPAIPQGEPNDTLAMFDKLQSREACDWHNHELTYRCIDVDALVAKLTAILAAQQAAIPQAVRNGVLSDGPTRWHDLKTDPEQWDNVAAGRKTFELRRNDRDFRPGDGLRLRKTANSAWAMTNTGAPLEYTGDVCERIVTHVLRGPIYGLAAGWAILSLSAASAPKEPTEPVPEPTAAARDVLAERQRQISAEGWTPEHDDQHAGGEMAMAAACYAAHSSAWQAINYTMKPGVPGVLSRLLSAQEFVSRMWPWDREWRKPKDERRNLVRAGALILAEIERLDRAAGSAIDGVASPINNSSEIPNSSFDAAGVLESSNG